MSYLDTYLGQLDAALSDPAVMELAIVRRRMIWNSLADFGAEGAGSSGSDYAAWR